MSSVRREGCVRTPREGVWGGLTLVTRRMTPGSMWEWCPPVVLERGMNDVLFVLLVISVFALLAMCVRGAERL